MRPPPSTFLPFDSSSSSSSFSRPDPECRLAPDLEREIFQGYFSAARADPRPALPDAKPRQAGQARYLQDDRPNYLPGGGRRGGRREGSERKEGRGEGGGGKRVAEPQMACGAFVCACVGSFGRKSEGKMQAFICRRRSSTRFWKWRATDDGADGSHRCSAVNYAARREGMKENWAPMGGNSAGGGGEQ